MLLAALVTSALVPAQCSLHYTNNAPLAASDGTVAAVFEWDSDGPGTATPILVFGGAFSRIGHIAANNVATFDPVTGVWSPMGAGIPGSPNYPAVFDFTVYQGNLIACGAFSGGFSGIAEWNGSSWLPFNGGVSSGGAPGVGQAIVVAPNGDLVIGGVFDNAGGVPVNNIARWTPTGWAAMGNGLPGSVLGLTIDINGDVVACGNFGAAVRRWNGATWVSVGAAGSPVESVATLPNGAATLVMAAGGHVFAYGAGAWTQLGTIAGVKKIVTMASGLVAMGTFPGGGMAQWSGVAWTPLNTPDDATTAVVQSQAMGTMVAIGSHYGLSSAYDTIRVLRGTWDPLIDGGTNGAIHDMVTLPNGDAVAVGDFTVIGGVDARFVARYDGTAWHALGAGLNGAALTAVVLSSGDLVVGGAFSKAGGALANHIARWDGSAWSTYGSGFNGYVYALARSHTTVYDFLIGGDFTTANGFSAPYFAFASGTAIGGVGLNSVNGIVRAILPLANNTALVGGDFTGAGASVASHVAQFSGSAFYGLGSGINGSVYDLALLNNGDVVAGGLFTVAGGVAADKVARWNGSSWSAMGSGSSPSGIPGAGWVQDLHVLPGGDLLAGGLFASAGGAAGSANVARWNGLAWSALATNGSVEEPHLPYMAAPIAIAPLANGRHLLGGGFAGVSGAVAGYMTEIESTCPAASITYAAGCQSSGGANLLRSVTLPWENTDWVTEASGLPFGASVFACIDMIVGGPVDLASAFPGSGTAGCNFYVGASIVLPFFPVYETVRSSLRVNPTPSLVGVSFYEQMLVWDFAGPLTATNVLQVTGGVF
ncbi:MAG: hypothetical protein JNL08_01870 [Planctomycetes bacterium]|nr:hypothetical protein [Planctomycetota bacterium]